MASFNYPAGSGGSSPFWGDSVSTSGSLPGTGTLGEVVFVRDTEIFYWWDGDSWENIFRDYVKGPSSATANAVPRYNSTTGKLIKNSSVVIDDSNNVTGVVTLTATTLNSTALTADRAVVTDGSKNLASSATTATELSYVNGVTSAIQTQLNTEATTRGNADTVLQSNIDDEETRALAAEGVLQSNIDDVDSDLALHEANVSNPHSVTKTQVGLGNVDNTSDADKPVSTAQATAIGVVQSDVDAHEADTANPHSVTAAQVGLGNVDNTSDATKNAASVTLTNKTLTNPELDNPLIDGYFDINEESEPGTPASGVMRVYAKSDSKLYVKNDAGVETEVGSGGAVVSAEVSYTPNASVNQGLGTLASVDVKYMRMGEFALIQGRFATGTVTSSELRFALPDGLTIASSYSNNTGVGYLYRNRSDATVTKKLTVVAIAGNAYLSVGSDDYTTNLAPLSNLNASSVLGTGETVSIECRVRIAEWVGSGTTDLVRTVTTLQETSVTPTDPASSNECRLYMKGDKLIIQFNDAGTVRYKYLDLTGTGVTWVHTTSAP